MFEEIVTALFLGCSAWTDWKKHEISLILTGIYASTGLIYSFMSGREIQDILIPAAIGVIFLLASVITGGALGMGDGWVMLALGCMTGYNSIPQNPWQRAVSVCSWYQRCFCTVVSQKPRNRNSFIPFLFLG